MLTDLPFLAIEFVARTVILLGLLWMMIKIQKLDQQFDYRFLGLAGAAALASGLDMIPYVGHPFAVPVLLVCIKKVTHADYIDALFTIAIAYALMFCVNLFILGSLMGDLRVRTENAREPEVVTPQQETMEAQPSAVMTNPAVPVAPTHSIKPVPAKPAKRPSPPTNPPVPGQPANPVKPIEATVPTTNPPVSTTNLPAPSALTNVPVSPPTKPPESLAKFFSVKGVARNAAKSAVTIQSEKKVYTIFLGEAVLTQTPDGPVSVRFSELNDDSVILEINGEKTKFILH